MPDTSSGITYPDSAGHPRLWEHLQTLAEDVEGLLYRAKTVANAAARDAIVAPPNGLVVQLQDTAQSYIRWAPYWLPLGEVGLGDPVAPTALAYAGGWGKPTTGQALRYKRAADGTVSVFGVAWNTGLYTPGAAARIATLPVGFRPTEALLVGCAISTVTTDIVHLDIQPDGDIIALRGPANIAANTWHGIQATFVNY